MRVRALREGAPELDLTASSRTKATKALEAFGVRSAIVIAGVAFFANGCQKKRELQDFPLTVGGLSFGTAREDVGAVCERLRSTPYDVGNDSSFACAPCPDPPVESVDSTLAKFCPGSGGPVLCELDFIPYERPVTEPGDKLPRQRYDDTLRTLRERYGEPLHVKLPHLACDEARDPLLGTQDMWGWGKPLVPGQPNTSSRGLILLSYGCTDRKKIVVTLAYRNSLGVQRNLDEYVEKLRETKPPP